MSDSQQPAIGGPMRTPRKSGKAGIVSAFTFFVLASSAAAGVALRPPLANSPSAHPHRLIVRYTTRAARCSACLPSGPARFASVTGTDSLDRLHERFRVQSARGVFVQAADEASARAVLDRHIARARQHYSTRAARAPRDVTPPDLTRVYVLDLGPGVEPSEAAAAFAADPDVEYAEPDYIMRASYVPDDPWLGELWGLEAVHATAAWDVSRGNGVVVAVIDTGVNRRHPDLAGNMWTNGGEVPRNRSDDDGNGFVDDVYGWDFTRGRNNPIDRNGHGTHVAGTIAAVGDNGRGVVGVAFGARIMAVRGLDARGEGWALDLAKAIVYAADNGADVLNNSWGSPSASSVIDDAVAYATSLGAVTVFAAGNQNSRYLGPAANPNAIAVAASAPGDARATFSNWGPEISVAAPGVDILSLRAATRVGGQTVHRRYRILSGTSMAAPHVSGTAALLLAQDPSLAVDEVRWHLELNADQPGWPGYEGKPWNPYFGWGRLNAERVFTPPPVTTRMPVDPLVLHAVSETVVPATTSIKLSFTTHDPVAWSLASPPWLIPSTTSGTGDLKIPLALDTIGLAPGSYDGAVAVTAPAAVDGGGSVAATVHVHQDVRSGSENLINGAYYPWQQVPIAATGDGNGAFMAWVNFNPAIGHISLSGAYINAENVVTGPFELDGSNCGYNCYPHKEEESVRLACDGTNFLVVWIEEGVVFLKFPTEQRTTSIKALHVSAAGQVLDSKPIEIATNVETSNNGGFYEDFELGGLGFDGAAYSLVWRRLDFASSTDPLSVYLRRIPSAGLPNEPAVTIYSSASSGSHLPERPLLACTSGSCLMAWEAVDLDASGLSYVWSVYGQRYAGTQPIDPVPLRLLTSEDWLSGVVSGAPGYLLLGYRYKQPAPNDYYDAIAARVALDGTPLDPDGVILNNGTLQSNTRIYPPSAAVFDGLNWIVTWEQRGPDPDARSLCYSFATRLGTGGTVLDADPKGLLLEPRARMSCGSPSFVATVSHSLLIWPDAEHANPSRILAQAVLAH